MKNRKEAINAVVTELIKYYHYEDYSNEIMKVAHCDIEYLLDTTAHFEHTEIPSLIKLFQLLENKKNKNIIISSSIENIKLDEYVTRTICRLLESHIQETINKKEGDNSLSYIEEIQQKYKKTDISNDDIIKYFRKHVSDFEFNDEVLLKSLQKTFTDMGMLKVNKKHRTGLNKEYAFINDMLAILKGESDIDWRIPHKEKADKVKYILNKDIHKGRYSFFYLDFFGKNNR